MIDTRITIAPYTPIDKIVSQIGVYGAGSRIYDGDCDITPFDSKTVRRLHKYPRELLVIIPPQDPITIIISLVVTVAVSLLLAPKIPNSASRNIPEASPNNGLSTRTNNVRIGARRPSIYGTVNSVPDLLVLPYKVFDDNGREIEFNYMFVSEGTVTGTIFKDGSTQLKYISGSAAELFFPGNSPSIGSPEINIGDPITEPFISPTKSSSVNGQTLRPPNKVFSTDNIKLIYPNRILFENDDDLTDKYKIGESGSFTNSIIGGFESLHFGNVNGTTITFYETEILDLPSEITTGNSLHIKNSEYSENDVIVSITALNEVNITTTDPEGGPDIVTINTELTISPSLSQYTPTPTEVTSQGETTYTPVELIVYAGPTLTNLGLLAEIETVSEDEITLVSTNWPSGLNTTYEERTFQVEGPRWTDAFVLDDNDLEGLIINLTASNGMFKDNGTQQFRSTVECTLGVTQIDQYDNEISVESLHVVTMKGSATLRDSVNKTLRVVFNGRCKVRIHRSSYKDEDFDGQVVDEVKWKDLYSFAYIGEHDINNTRIRTSTIATEGALSLKERKLIIEDATRMLPRFENGAFTSELYPSLSAADALISISTDQKIGRRTLDEINVEQIYETESEINDYFQSTKHSQFSYTLDSSDLSFEDTFTLISNAIYCTAYRRGISLNLSFEKEQDTSTLLFNHRNKTPGSEKRTIQFGVKGDSDGATCKWIDSSGIEKTVSVPSDNLLQPIEVPLLGLNEEQATKQAWRHWFKAKYQNLFTEFEATDEAALSVTGQRFLIEDNTLAEVYDGEVIFQQGNILKLSNDVPDNGWIHLQLPNATIEVIEFTKIEEKKINLSDSTSMNLSTNPNNYARCVYLISEESSEESVFLLLERDGNSPFTMKMGNYDSRFYQNDIL